MKFQRKPPERPVHIAVLIAWLDNGKWHSYYTACGIIIVNEDYGTMENISDDAPVTCKRCQKHLELYPDWGKGNG